MVITWQLVLSVCGGFSCVFIALKNLFEAISIARKPAVDMRSEIKELNTKVVDTQRRVDALEEVSENNNEAISLLLRSNLVILGHLSTNNNKGEMTKMQEMIHEYLIDKNKM